MITTGLHDDGMRTAFVLRLTLIGLGAALGVALVIHGNYVIGGLLCLMAVMRIAMVISMRHRRRELMARRRRGGGYARSL